MYGVSQTSLQTILLTARCEVEVIHDRHDTLFGGRLPAPNIHTLGTLVNFVLDHHCDLGIATDGDADRLGVIDDKGQFVHPNKLLVLLYYYLLKYRGWRGPAVRNNSTTHLLDKVAAGFGQACYEVPVGFKYVSAKWRKPVRLSAVNHPGFNRQRTYPRERRYLCRHDFNRNGRGYRKAFIRIVQRNHRSVW